MTGKQRKRTKTAKFAENMSNDSAVFNSYKPEIVISGITLPIVNLARNDLSLFLRCNLTLYLQFNVVADVSVFLPPWRTVKFPCSYSDY